MLWVVPVLVQITLDPLLIFGFGLGVSGAALGTVGGQAVSAGMAVWFFFIRRRRPYRIALRDLRPHGPTIRALLAVGAPSFLAGLGMTLLAVLVNATLAAAGAIALAAYAVGSRVQTFVSMPQTGITQGIQPVVGFNAGRGLDARVHRARTLGLRATVVYGILAAAVVALAAHPIASRFLTDPAAIDLAATAIRIVAVGFAFAGVPSLVSAYFQAIGRPMASYVISIGTLVVVRIPLVLALGSFGPVALWAALPIGDALSALAAWAVLRREGAAGRRWVASSTP